MAFNIGQTVSNFGSQAANRAKSQIGSRLGINLGGSSADMSQLYQWFFEVLLTKSNSLPIQSLWLLYFTEIPKQQNTGTQFREHQGGSSVYITGEQILKSSDSSKPGMIFAHAVKIPGDGFESQRVGLSMTGLPKGIISNNRKDYENLNISFLETNYSFTDNLLRPWSVMVSYQGLKTSLKTDVTIVQLMKTPQGFKQRNMWTFKQVCPVNIDTQEYDYGADKVVMRQVEFAYNDYSLNTLTIEDNPISNILSTLGVNRLLDTVNPTNLINRAVDTGIDILVGGGQKIATNVTGAVQGKIEGLISQGQQFLRSQEEKLTGNITDAANNMIDKIIQERDNKDTPTYKPQPSQGPVAAISSTVPTIVNAGLNDTPFGSIAPEQTIKTISTKDQIDRIRTAIKPIIVPDAPNTKILVNIPSKDTPVFNSVVDLPPQGTIPKNINEVKQILQNQDTPDTTNLVVQTRTISQNDTSKTIPQNRVNISQNDIVKNVSIENVQIGQDDIVKRLNNQQVNIKQNDTPKKIDSQNVTIKTEKLQSNSIPVQIVTIRD